jgi:hypothetical protein
VPADLFPAKYHCIRCKQEKDGRFTKHKFSSGNGWSQGMQVLNWYCWECLPKGDGRDETPD